MILGLTSWFCLACRIPDWLFGTVRHCQERETLHLFMPVRQLSSCSGYAKAGLSFSWVTSWVYNTKFLKSINSNEMNDYQKTWSNTKFDDLKKRLDQKQVFWRTCSGQGSKLYKFYWDSSIKHVLFLILIEFLINKQLHRFHRHGWILVLGSNIQ